jgi:hypothetical protein
MPPFDESLVTSMPRAFTRQPDAITANYQAQYTTPCRYGRACCELRSKPGRLTLRRRRRRRRSHNDDLSPRIPFLDRNYCWNSHLIEYGEPKYERNRPFASISARETRSLTDLGQPRPTESGRLCRANRKKLASLPRCGPLLWDAQRRYH